MFLLPPDTAHPAHLTTPSARPPFAHAPGAPRPRPAPVGEVDIVTFAAYPGGAGQPGYPQVA